ncbi:amino acid adenylation domain-containing protein [Actinoplanes sp. KI2]|uniref:amino acid adenylation domain-containing protein n=1 Tax=Actinoplanes sp. KI2 TaxID=2983315 RepID=UPI0021D5C44C|nr:amino acid adenylation domain-containing protein [Actinoplanes sp. KI2]MCU7729687.1 amino acid adenylation domain-containing protein [Actinoplanes sp. KI2]
MIANANSLTHLFQEVARQRPDHVAITDGDTTLSYRELDAASDRLAARLQATGVRPGDRVGLLLGRSAQIPVGILAVLKAGAAYVPLDPGYPADRLRYIVGDAEIRTVVGRPEDADLVGFAPGALLDPTADADGGEPAVVSAGPADVAYVIYTSGSTGRPKGCLVSHGNVLSLLRAALPLFEVGPLDRWALFHSFSFDVSVWEFWASMSTGATAVVVPQEAAQSPAEFLNLLRTSEVTVLGQVPSVFRSLALAYEDAGRPALALRYLVFAGESVDLDVIAGFRKAFTGGPIIPVNMYGPTETTVYATHRILTDADFEGSVRSPIGHGLANTTIELCDENLAPVPEGEAGEMLIGGEAVAVGYLNRPELTGERFVTRDTAAGPRRYYRTGDLARRLPDGSLEFLGRNDAQIKLRGFRIELGEIEAALRTHPAVRDVAVTVTTTSGGAQFLVACVVPTEPVPAKLADELRPHAMTTLPRYMVPDRYKQVDQLPLTGSGKLDRNAVRQLAAARAPRR